MSDHSFLQCFDIIGHALWPILPVKNCPRSELLYVGWDVTPYSRTGISPH